MCLQEEKPPAPRLALDVMFGTWGKSVGVWLTAVAAGTLLCTTGIASDFRFDRDTCAFANQTVFEYHEGHPSLRRGSSVRRDMYKRHCFVLCRTAIQFKKFARFDPRGAPLDDTSLAARIRAVTHRQPWTQPLPKDQRIVFPGYKDLREMSKARRELVQLNIGHGWPSYFRISNARMIFQPGAGYQEATHAHLNAALARGQLFAGFLTTFPVSASIIPSCFLSGSRFRRIPESKRIMFTIRIIQSPRASLPGPRTLAVSPIKKIGIS